MNFNHISYIAHIWGKETFFFFNKKFLSYSWAQNRQSEYLVTASKKGPTNIVHFKTPGTGDFELGIQIQIQMRFQSSQFGKIQ